jgi:hypothetical protein
MNKKYSAAVTTINADDILSAKSRIGGLFRQLAGASGGDPAFMPIALWIAALTEALGGLLFGLRQLGAVHFLALGERRPEHFHYCFPPVVN